MRPRLPKETFEEIAARRRSPDAVALIDEIRRLQVIEVRARDLLLQMENIPTVRSHPTASLIMLALRNALGETEPPGS